MAEAKITEKRWNKDFEPDIYNSWKSTNRYAFDKSSDKPIYSIDTPPPYVNAPVHIGQATTYVLMDMFARFKRMKGFNVIFPLGLDQNGLPIEVAAERKFKISLTETPREEFVEYCHKILAECSLASVETFIRSGLSFNSWEDNGEIGDLYYTDSDKYRALTQNTFIDMWHKGLIYEDERVNNYCPGCQTTLADAEIEYEDKHSHFNDIAFKVKETDEEIVIGTTRPELVCTCGMVIFHPDDDRYKHLDGKTAISPIFEKEIPIKAHPAAHMDKGTGLVMMCSVGDLTDIRFFREQGLDLVIAINKDGTMNEHAGFLKGLKVREARKTFIEELKNKNLLKKQEEIMHRTPICERSKDEVEFIEMKELYVKQIDFKDKMLELANELTFYDSKSREILTNWIDKISIDWPITRRRYYATEVPVWYCKDNNHPFIPEKGHYYKPWKDKAPIDKCPECGCTEFEGDKRVFDTWFDSSISPLYILGYERHPEFFAKAKKASLRPQGKEIVRTWLYYTVLKCWHLTGECIFDDAWINYHILDEKGYKMSKSKGNVIDPKDILDKFGAEPFRLWAAIEGNLTKTDFMCSYERIEGSGKTLTKLWNIARFISMFPEPEENKTLMASDKWIMKEMNELIKFTEEAYNNYDFHNPAIKIKHFLWETFASHYLELVKTRAYNQDEKFTKEEQNGALYSLNYCLDNLLKLLAPILPMITFKLYNDLRNKDIHAESFPEPEEEHSDLQTSDIEEANSTIWKAKQDAGLSLKSELSKVQLKESLRALEKELKQMHSIQEITFGEETKIN